MGTDRDTLFAETPLVYDVYKQLEDGSSSTSSATANASLNYRAKSSNITMSTPTRIWVKIVVMTSSKGQRQAHHR